MVLIALCGELCLGAVEYASARVSPPSITREFRGAWVATVGNIDWPSTNALSVEQQKAELVAILDKATALRLNAIIFQVRPACDAMYASQLEPWSEYLTGEMGKAPQPAYDPLEMAVREAHERGLELHAWFNPYRARHSQARSPVSSKHISRTRPHLVKQYGRSLWLDPGEPEVQDHSLSVVMDVVRRYDIDGVHFDDYFYPYKERDAKGNELDFPDGPSWKKFGEGGKLSREDWRRENVNVFLARVYRSIKQSKPSVEFGLSPFGIWRPGNPPQVQGFDAYAKLYADSRKWFHTGCVDYLAPQLYWAIDPPAQSFPALLKWWAGQNPKHRQLYPGLNTSNTRRAWKPDEITRQIQATRKQSGANGHIHWNMRALMRVGGVAETLPQVYATPALPPAMPWLDAIAPARPELSAQANDREARLSWRDSGPERAFCWVLQTRRGKTWTTEILPGKTSARVLRSPLPDALALRAADRSGNLSQAAGLQRR